ncbi:DMT family transporter [Roseibium sp. ROS1]
MTTTPVLELHNIPKAIGLTLISLVLFGIQDIAVKSLAADFSPLQLVMIRFWGVGLFMLVWLHRGAGLRAALKSHFPGLQILRSVLLLIDIWLFTAVLGHMQTSDLQAVFMLYPIVVSVMAVPLLGETMGGYRWSAVMVGFAGALIVIRPGFEKVDISMVFALGAVISFSLYTVLTRKVAMKDSTKTSMLYLTLVAVLLSTGMGVFQFKEMGITALLVMAAIIVCAISTHILFTEALKYAPASTLQPLNFLALPIAVILTYLFFDYVTDPLTLLGGVVTVIAGLMVWFGDTGFFRNRSR